ncbi:hypothetical protein GEOBRER4_n1006 [Citrifermentans bremense]|uniref:Uncharacterized protein n=1 Tax=Citrifermentans bremense TaxID=60035 RepID=A0A6S6LZ33_9BACT|nr:hypothetical protein [Citrifermentans bremense]BCG46220.1 hypothetical protein GEOBRER4_n1006 [Citrifermentans bremense]
MAKEPAEYNSKLISNIGSLVAVTSAMSVLLSVLYEFGYYRLGAGIPIPKIPTAMSDHLKACFMWLPIAIAMIASAFLTILVLKAKEKPSKVSSASDNSIEPVSYKKRNLHVVPISLIVLSTIVSIILYLIKVPNYFFISSLAWILFYVIQYIAAIFSEIFIKKGKYSDGVYIGAMLSANILIYFITSGYTNARSEIEAKEYKYEITLKDATSPKIKANILRSYDKVTFFTYSSQKLVFMQNDQIKSIATR